MIQPIDNASVIEGTATSPSGVEAQSLAGSTFKFTSPAFHSRESFLVCSPWIDDNVQYNPNKDVNAVIDDQKMVAASPLFQPLSRDVSRQNVRVQGLQRWTGTVSRVMQDRFLAIIRDMTTPANPAEEVELDIQEVSRPDRSLIAPGAIFYWAIVYRDNSDGSRERITTLRFARQPKLNETDIEDIFEEADKVTELLQSA